MMTRKAEAGDRERGVEVARGKSQPEKKKKILDSHKNQSFSSE